MAASIGDRRKPAQLARQSQQRLRVITCPENPEAWPRGTIVNPDAGFRFINHYALIDRLHALKSMDRETGEGRVSCGLVALCVVIISYGRSCKGTSRGSGAVEYRRDG